jgi:DNA-binding response OmpR family regulator
MLPGERINLTQISVLIVDDNPQALDMIGYAVTGFGVRNIIKCGSVKEARDIIGRTALDFVITDAQMPEEDGFELLRWLRREAEEPNRHIPAIVVCGHTRVSDVTRARDCGAHFIVAKPISPKILLERIFWVARDERQFVESVSYAGPDRRFKRLGPPAGVDGRRSDDANGALGAAKEPNLSQDEIDSFMKPAKVAL